MSEGKEDSNNATATLINYPFQGDESVLRTVVFGPAVDKINILISIDQDESGDPVVQIALGNATPDNDREKVKEFLLELAEVIHDLALAPGFDVETPGAPADEHDD